MKDLDFDELDRAVSSLMGGVGKSDLEPVKIDDTKTITIKPTISNTDKVNLANLATQISSVNTTKPSLSSEPVTTTPSTPAKRKAGRFMDVVHSSSDMKTIDKPSFTMPSRSGITIEPRVSQSDNLSEDATPVTPTPVVEDNVVAETPSAVEESITNDWPDPLELSPDSEIQELSEPDEIEELEEEPEHEEEIAEPVVIPTEIQPLSSPFLFDTKVEKRPLGSANLQTNNDDIVTADTTETTVPEDELAAVNNREDIENTHDVEAQLPPNQVSPEIRLPEELQGDLMAIESDTTSAPIVQSIPRPNPEPISQPAKPAATVFGNQTSIVQQYHEEPSTGDQENGSIYDTDSYHQPLLHPAKKKSGWMWVVWIVLILLVGAGSGAALYFSGIF